MPDLNGIDPEAHNNDTSIIIQSISDWLKTSSNRTATPGHVIIIDNFESFQASLPAILKGLGLESATHLFNDLCLIIEEF